MAADLEVKPESTETETEPIIHLVARNPQEMAAAQTHLAEWFRNKIALVEVEVKELNGAIEEAAAHNWQTRTLAGQSDRADERLRFYQKCLLAVEQGYTIIPDIPIDVFAIRTSRAKPLQKLTETNSQNEWTRPSINYERPQVLPAGEGDYQNPSQLVRTTHSTYKDEEGTEHHIRTIKATAFGQIEFPIIAAVPYVMNATQQAMAKKVFDQIGVSPQGASRSADPLIIGQIFCGRTSWGFRKTASFLIAWHLDLRTL